MYSKVFGDRSVHSNAALPRLILLMRYLQGGGIQFGESVLGTATTHYGKDFNQVWWKFMRAFTNELRLSVFGVILSVFQNMNFFCIKWRLSELLIFFTTHISKTDYSTSYLRRNHFNRAIRCRDIIPAVISQCATFMHQMNGVDEYLAYLKN